MGLLRFYTLADRKQLVLGYEKGLADTPYTVPPFNQGDTPEISHMLLRAGGGVRAKATIVPPGEYGLGVGLYTNTPASTELAYQGTWAASGDFKVARLVFNSSNLSTAMGSSEAIDARLVIKITDDGYDETYYDEVVRIKRRRIPSPETTVASGEQAATVSFCKGTFAPLAGCKGIVWEDIITGEQKQMVLMNGSLQFIDSPLPS